MNQFTVPQFIEHKPKIVGPLTFGQFIYVAIPAGISFFLYFTAPFFIFVILAIALMSAGGILAFGNIKGMSLPTALKNFSAFSFAPKIYLWKKKTGPPPKFIERAVTPEEKMASPVPTIVGKSQLKDLSRKIDTGTK